MVFTTPSYSYVDVVDQNLICCICRLPFIKPVITQTCSHTFCYDCIVHSIGISPQCPVDRSALNVEHLSAADPVVRHLVDELMVECSERAAGCTYSCQRQLLASHIKDECQYVSVPCEAEDCVQTILRKDMGHHVHDSKHRLVRCESCETELSLVDSESHQLQCSAKTATCGACSTSFPRSQLTTHQAHCSEFVVPCTQVENGCPWTGPRHALLTSHVPSCPYESIKGFFPVNNARISKLSEENVVLKHKVEALEGMMRAMTREMYAVKTALGPWYKPNESIRQPPSRTSVSYPEQRQRSHSVREAQDITERGDEQTNMPSEIASGPSLPATATVADLAPYFPPLQREAFDLPDNTNFDMQSLGSYPTSYGATSRSHVMPHPYQEHPRLSNSPSDSQYTYTSSPIAPLNLSTTLEGTLNGLHQSIVTISTSLDSLARRSEIALSTDTRMMNEELMCLRVAVQGLRMQVHTVMMDRNAQVTGRTSDRTQASLEGGMGWVPPPGFHNRSFTPIHPASTKL